MEFGTTFLVLPARVNVSRELMYTALTSRQVVIRARERPQACVTLAAPWRSERHVG